MKKAKIKLLKIFKFALYLLFYFEIRKIRKFKNVYYGQECYVLGDSAQIKYYDLTLFDDRPMFCFNVSYLINDIRNRKSQTFAMTIEPFYFLTNVLRGLKDKIFFKKTPINMAKYTLDYITKNKTTFFLSLTNLMSFFNNSNFSLFYQLPGDKFTKLVNKTGYKWNAGAFQSSIALAIYMGFKKINVIGVSYHSNSVVNRWYHRGLGLKKISETDRHFNLKNSDVNLLKDYFELAKEFVDIEIITPKNIDKSILFDTISYSTFTGDDLKYKENITLVDLSFLEACKASNHATNIAEIL